MDKCNKSVKVFIAMSFYMWVFFTYPSVGVHAWIWYECLNVSVNVSVFGRLPSLPFYPPLYVYVQYMQAVIVYIDTGCQSM